MARALSIYCDMCGADITLDHCFSINLGRSRQYDLCQECYDSLSDKLDVIENLIHNMADIGEELRTKFYKEAIMGMTIDEAKRQLIMQKSYALGRDYEAIEVALETIRKYQKIEDIYYHQRGEALENSLRAVIEGVESND